MLKWRANPAESAVGRVREPISGESFAGIQERAQSLLREAVQNSLDARLGTRPVRIRAFIARGNAALTRTKAALWFADAWSHISADPKLKNFDPNQPCHFLTLEDFNTKGLQGDLTERLPDEDTKNAWCLFFRKEGQSAKADSDRGRWGVGKVVFPLCSQAHAFLAATVRADDNRRLLMGQAMLRSRAVGGKKFLPDLWYCISPSAPNEIELPSEDPNDFDRLRATFGIERDREPGLTVVVPYLDESITFEPLVRAAIKEFFLPVLDGSLVFDIESDESASAHLDQSTLPDLARRFLTGPDEFWLNIVEMARWYLEHSEDPIAAQPPVERYGFEWSDDQLTSDQIAQARMRLREGSPIHVTVPMPVLPKRRAVGTGHFDVILRLTPEGSGRRPIFVRQDLIIPEVKATLLRGATALVIAREPLVSRMLGDAENPAHTEWSRNSSNFEYRYPDKHLSYVRQSAANLLKVLEDAQDEVSTDALLDFFSIEAPDTSSGPEPTGKGGRKSGRNRVTPPKPRPKAFSLTRTAGGYVLRSTDHPIPQDTGIEVNLAYSARRGDPLRRYAIHDFDVSKMAASFKGLRVLEKAANRILVLPTDKTFEFELQGFDQRRDLYVRGREVRISE